MIPPQVYQPSTQLALPAHTPAILYNGTYKAPYTVKAQGNLVNYRPTVETMLRIGPSTETLARKSAINLVNEFNKWNPRGREVIPVGHGTQLQIPFPKPYVTPTVGVRDIPMPTLTPTVLGKYWGNKKMNDIFNMQSMGLRPIIPDGSVQTTMFKKGGKVKKVRKCENGFPGYAQGLDLGIRFDNKGNVVNIDPITGLPKDGNAIDLNEVAMSQPHLYRNNDGEIVRRPKLKTDGEGIYGNGGFTQGVDKKSPYN